MGHPYILGAQPGSMRFCEVVVGGSGCGAHLMLCCLRCSLCSGVDVYVSLMLVLLEVLTVLRCSCVHVYVSLML